VGNVVTVAGSVAIDPTTASNGTAIGLSLPLPSSVPIPSTVGGVASRDTLADSLSAVIQADAGNTRATLQFFCNADVSNRTWYFTFTYLIA
jgi:hypothetical protein